MAITDRDRKLLWARSGGFCALCKGLLTEEKTETDRDVVIGVEAHIASGRTNGPRYRPLSTPEVDAYENLLLLCPTDHTRVDQQTTLYSEERLLEIKQSHEKWARDRGTPTLPRIQVRDPERGKPVLVQRVETGQELMGFVAGTYGAYIDRPQARSNDEVSLGGGFLQDVTDWSDIWDDIGPSGQMEAELSLTGELKDLREAGFLIYAGVRNQVIEGGVRGPEPWPTAYLMVRRAEDAEISSSDETTAPAP